VSVARKRSVKQAICRADADLLAQIFIQIHVIDLTTFQRDVYTRAS